MGDSGLEPATSALSRQDEPSLTAEVSSGCGKPRRQTSPGGWNRFQLEVADIEATVAELRRHNARFRNDIVTGVGGRQILVEDPSGNPVELFEPTRAEARLAPPA